MSSTQNQYWHKDHWLNFLIITILGFAIRLVIALNLQQSLDAQNKFDLIAGDAEGYWELALDIVHGRDYSLYDPPRYVERMPGFPLVLTIPVLLFGEKLLWARLFLSALGGLTCGMVYVLARLCSCRNHALLAGLLACFIPLHAGYSVLFLSETVFALCMLSSLCCWHTLVARIRNDCSYLQICKSSIIFAICTVLAINMKPSWLLAPGGLYLGEIILMPGKFQKLVLSGMIALLTIFICLTPWIARNYLVSKHFVPTTLWMGPSLYDGLNPAATGKSNMRFVDEDQLFQQHTEYEVDQIYKHRAYLFAIENPPQVLKLALVKLGLFVKPWASAEEIRSWWGHLISMLSTLTVLVGSSIGFLWWKTSKSTILMLVWPIVYFALLHMIFVSSMRYRLPADYPLMIASAYLFLGISQRIKGVNLLKQSNPQREQGISNA